MLLQIVFRRSRPGSTKKPIPIMYLMDECQNFVTKSVADIVNEAAKFQLFITMAQLQIGQGMSNDLRDAVLNASVQIGGVNKSALRPGVAKMLGVEPDDIAALERGGFIINMTGLRPFAFRTHKHLLDWNNSISDSEWEAVKADQLRRYYRLVEAPVPAPAAPLPEHDRRSPLRPAEARQSPAEQSPPGTRPDHRRRQHLLGAIGGRNGDHTQLPTQTRELLGGQSASPVSRPTLTSWRSSINSAPRPSPPYSSSCTRSTKTIALSNIVSNYSDRRRTPTTAVPSFFTLLNRCERSGQIVTTWSSTFCAEASDCSKTPDAFVNITPRRAGRNGSTTSCAPRSSPPS